MRRTIRPFVKEFKRRSAKSLASNRLRIDDAGKDCPKPSFWDFGVFAASRNNHDDEYEAALQSAEAVFARNSSVAEAPSSNSPVGRVLPSLSSDDDAQTAQLREAGEDSRGGRQEFKSCLSQSLDPHHDEYEAALRSAEAVFARSSVEVEASSSNSPVGRVLPSLSTDDDVPTVPFPESDDKARGGPKVGKAKSLPPVQRKKPTRQPASEVARRSTERAAENFVPERVSVSTARRESRFIQRRQVSKSTVDRSLELIRAKIAEVEAKIANLRIAERELLALEGSSTRQTKTASAPKPKRKPGPKAIRKPEASGEARQTIGAAITAVLNQHGALSAGEIAEQIIATGRHIHNRTVSFALQALKKRGLAKNIDGKWMPLKARSRRTRSLSRTP